MWVSSELGCDCYQVTGSGLLLGAALVAYRKSLFYDGSPKYMFSETLNAVCDGFKHFKPFLAAGWNVLMRWEEEEPVERSMVMPEPESLFKASTARVCTFSGSFFWAASLHTRWVQS